MKKVVVLGAGYAGILAAKKIAKQTKKRSDVDISIIDRNPFHTMLTELHEVAAGRVEEDSVRISLNKVFAGRKVRVVHDNVTAIDTAGKSITGERGAYPYDVLVLAGGSKPTFFGVPGAEEHTFTLWSYEDATRLREHIMEMFRRASAEPDVEKKKALLTFCTVGAGFTGVEMAGELAELALGLCARFEIDPSLVNMIDVDMLDRVCTVLPDKISAKVQRRLEKMRVNVMLKTSVKAVGADYIEYDAGKGVVRVPAQTVIWTAGIEGAQITETVTEALGKPARGRGRVQTNAYLQSVNDKSVYAIGDNMFYVPEGETAPAPQMVENAEQSAEVAAHNVVCDITGAGEKKTYAPKLHGVMVCVGGRWGAAHVGTVKTKFALPSFFAMFSKHFINIIYFIQVLGWNKIFSYVKHEFFTVRNKRSFVGGHFSNRGPSFLIAPLRVYLGLFWFCEGVGKIVEGWLTGAKLGGFFSGTNAWYDSVLNAAGGAADAAAAATGEVADAAASASGEAVAAVADAVSPVIINWDILGLIRPILLNMDNTKFDAGSVAFKLQIPLMDWMVNATVLPYPTVQMVMQITIVFAEILVGLALMGGLFTTPAAAVSLLLQGMFLTSTGLYMSSWWMIPAGVACMFGAGAVLSLDYYVMPWLKKHWKRVGFVKRLYWYND